MTDKELLYRLTKLEDEMQELERKVAYYDKMAAKWGGFIMGFLMLGTILAIGFDKAKDKILGWILP